jgi:hypothetical protein
MASYRYLLAAGLLLLVGCAGDSQKQRDQCAVSSSGVPAPLQVKMESNVPLDLDDIIALTKHKVDDAVTLRYLRSLHNIYSLNDAEVTRLRSAGVSEKVINYLISTPMRYNPSNKYWPLNSSSCPSRDPLLNGQGIPRS